MCTPAIVGGALVYIRTALAVVIQRKAIFARTFHAARFVGAGVRTATVVRLALIDIQTALSVVGIELVAVLTDALVAAVGVVALVGAATVIGVAIIDIG